MYRHHRIRPVGLRQVLQASAALALGSSLLGGCAEVPPEPSKDIEPQFASPDSIPDGPVNGTLDNKPFSAQDSRFYVDRREGYEKLDIKLSATEVEDHCGTLRYAQAPMVWIRRRGVEPLEPGTYNIKPGDDSPWQVHYQVKDGDYWVGNGDAAAILVIRSASLRQIVVGDLSVCFADGKQSCVSGTFMAHYCPISVDLPVRGADSVEKLPDAGVVEQLHDENSHPGDAGAEDDGGKTEAADGGSAGGKP